MKNKFEQIVSNAVPWIGGVATRTWAMFKALKPSVTVLGVMVVVLFAAYFALLSAAEPVQTGKRVSLDRFVSMSKVGMVKQATIFDEDARIVFTADSGSVAYTAYPKSDAQTADLIDLALKSGARVEVDDQPEKARLKFIAQFLMPLVILAALFGLLFVIVSGQGGMSEFLDFGSIGKGSNKQGASGSITFANVAACKEAIIELQEIVDYLKAPERFASLGAQAPKGVLLSGPPGTGKTLLARAVAGEAGVPFYSISGSEFVESLVGVGAARVRDLFAQARQSAPSIVFIDEFDAAGRQRGAGMGQGNDEREQTLNQLLVEMDGFSVTSGIVVLGATNRPDILDPALLRPGRFDRQVVVDVPDLNGRIEILELYAAGRPLDADTDLERLARQCPGFTGADLSSLINEAALLAVREGRNSIGMRDLEEAVDRVISGPARKSHVLTEEERRQVAVHEAGHAVVAKAIGIKVGVQKLSIVARGRSLGHTTTYELSDRLILSKSDLQRQLITALGGLAAEEVVLGETTTAVEGDLHQATSLARSMVATYGMGETLGRMAFGQRQGEVFLGRDIVQTQHISPATQQAVDEEVRDLLARAESAAREIVKGHLPLITSLVKGLLAKETLSGPELQLALRSVSGDISLPLAVTANGNGSKRVRSALRN